MKINNLIRYIIAAVTILIIGLIVWWFADIVAYMVIAWVLSLLGGPFMKLFRRIKIGRFRVGPNIAAVMTLISFFLIISLIVSLFVPLVLQQARNLADVDAAALVEGLEGFWQPINEKPFFFLKEDGLFMRMMLILAPNRYQSEVTNVIERIVKLLTRYFGGILFQITIITIFVSTLLGILNIQNALFLGFSLPSRLIWMQILLLSSYQW